MTAVSAPLCARSPIREPLPIRPATPWIECRAEIELLETLDVVDRLKLALRLQTGAVTENSMFASAFGTRWSPGTRAATGLFSARQMEAIRKEAWRDRRFGFDEYQKKIAAAQMPSRSSGRQNVNLGGWSGWGLERRSIHDPNLSRLAAGRAWSSVRRAA